MHIVLVWYKIKPKQIDLFRNRVLEHAQNCCRMEEHCRRFDVGFDPIDRSTVFLYEAYDAESDFENHRRTEHFKEYQEDTDAWVESKQVHILTTGYFS